MATVVSSGNLKIGYKGKMFAQPKCQYELTHIIPEGESPEETKLLVAAFKKLFTNGFNKLAKTREKAIKAAMEGTEKDINKKPPADMDAFIKTANQLIQQGVDVWRKVEVVRLADDCIAKCYDYVEKKLKKAVTKKKVKTVLKIIALVLIVVVVAAASIAATVLTGGIAAVVIAAAIATGIGALVKIGKIIYKEYQDYNKFLEKIEKDIEAITKAIDYEIKKKKAQEYRKLGPKERVKLLMNGTKSHVKSLKKHLAAAEGRMILLRKANLMLIAQANEAQENWEKMASHPNADISAEAKKAREIAGRTKHKVVKFEKKKADFAKLKSEANAQLARLEKTGEFTSEKVSGLIKFARDHEGTANFLMTAIKALATSGKKIAKAVK